MNRRDSFLALLALGALTSPRVATPQSSTKMPTVGVLNLGATVTKDQLDRWSFLIRLKELGWVEGKSIRFELVYADNKYELLSALAADLVRKKVDIIVAMNPDTSIAAVQATKSIPIVFRGVTQPVEMGLVDSYARPGGNVTGVAWNAGVELYTKLLGFVKEISPGATRIAYIRHRAPGSDHWRMATQLKIMSAAKTIGLEPRVFFVSGPEDFATAFKDIRAWRPGALFSLQNPVTSPQMQRMADFANTQKIPSFCDGGRFVELGGLFSYGPDIEEVQVLTADQVDRILRGAKPAELPVQIPTRYMLFVNQKTAKLLGIKIPRSILQRADRVIE